MNKPSKNIPSGVVGDVVDGVVDCVVVGDVVDGVVDCVVVGDVVDGVVDCVVVGVVDVVVITQGGTSQSSHLCLGSMV